MERLTKVFRAHEQLSNLLISLIDDLNFDVVTQSEDAVKRTSKMVKDLVAVQITGCAAHSRSPRRPTSSPAC
jgi:hypothetical protein